MCKLYFDAIFSHLELIFHGWRKFSQLAFTNSGMFTFEGATGVNESRFLA